MIYRVVAFLIINFLGLALGGIFTKEGVTSSWYLALEKAPWTPPGWVFGAAWTTIMICFAFYMAFAFKKKGWSKTLVGLFGIQWILNLIWNPIFFYYHQVMIGLFVISLLTLLIGFILSRYCKLLGYKSALLLPYFLWLLIATSLNAYILFNN